MSSCAVCDLSFKSIDARQQHERDSLKHAKRAQQQQQEEQDRNAPPDSFVCNACDRRFRTTDSLQQHTKDTLHGAAETLQQPAPGTSSTAVRLECGACERYFGSNTALLQHQKDLPGHAMGSLRHGTQRSTDGMGATRCAPCGRPFASMEALQQHKRDSPAHTDSALQGTLPGVHMHTINAAVPVEQPVNQQNQSTRQQHGSVRKSANFQYPRCSRFFNSENALQMHKDSSQVCVEDSSWSIYPDLHDAISQQLQADGLWVEFHEGGQYEDSIRDYDTRIMGAFTCPKRSCQAKRWTSKKVAISIRLFDDELYNAVVWHQRCQNCKSMGRLKLDVQSYIDRVVYRLGKWLGLVAVPPTFPRRVGGRQHVRELCEGCKSGHCPENDSEDD